MCTPEAAFAAALISAGATVQQGRIQQRNIENQEAVARFQAQAQITELEGILDDLAKAQNDFRKDGKGYYWSGYQ